MSAPSHCKHRRIVSTAFSTSLFFGREMRIELAALSSSMSSLLICDRQLRSSLHVRICARTLKKSAARSENSAMCKMKFCEHERCLLKLTTEISQHFYSALRAPTALVIGVCLSRMPKLFPEDRYLSLNFAINSVINRQLLFLCN